MTKEKKPTLTEDVAKAKSKGRAMRMFVKVKSKTTKQREPDKGDQKSISLFSQIRDEDGKVVLTANLNLNNIEGAGEAYLRKVFGADVVPGTPMVMDLTIPKGNLLEDWTEAMKEHPDQTDLDDHEE